MSEETLQAVVTAPDADEKPEYGNISIEELDTPEYSDEERQQFAAMYESSFTGIKEGEIVKGRIVGIHPQEVLIDIGFKSEGAISIREFSDPEGIEIGASALRAS